MLEILLTVLFVWLLFKVIGLAFRVAWGAAKIAASILFTLAVPLLVLCLIFAGGVLILIPLAMLGGGLWAAERLHEIAPCPMGGGFFSPVPPLPPQHPVA